MGRNADAIEEGLAIAHAAARLAVKNRILVGTISLDGSFDAAAYLDEARAVLTDLADEADRAAEGLKKAKRHAWGRFTESTGTHDYRDRDVKNLRRRARQSAGVAKALRAEAADDAQVAVLVEAAREAAWHDVESTLQNRLRVEAMRPEQDPNYAAMRDARMQALRLVDLQKLSAQTKDRRDES